MTPSSCLCAWTIPLFIQRQHEVPLQESQVMPLVPIPIYVDAGHMKNNPIFSEFLSTAPLPVHCPLNERLQQTILAGLTITEAWEGLQAQHLPAYASLSDCLPMHLAERYSISNMHLDPSSRTLTCTECSLSDESTLTTSTKIKLYLQFKAWNGVCISKCPPK